MASLSDMLSDPIGSIGNHISENPYSTAATVIGAPMTMGFSSLLGAAGRAADSYNQSVAADAALANDIGISPEGPDIGRSRTTSALADFFGYSHDDQMSDIQDAASDFYDGSLGFDASLDQGDEYGPGAYTSTPGSAIGVGVTNTFDDATSALDGAIAAALGSNARGLGGVPGQIASAGPTNTATNGFYGAYDAYGIHGGGDAESGANSYGGWDAGGGTGAGWGADGNWVGDGGYGGGGSVGGGGGQTAAEAAAGFAAGSMGAAEGAPGAMFDDDGNIGIDSNYAGGGGGGGGGGGAGGKGGSSSSSSSSVGTGDEPAAAAAVVVVVVLVVIVLVVVVVVAAAAAVVVVVVAVVSCASFPASLSPAASSLFVSFSFFFLSNDAFFSASASAAAFNRLHSLLCPAFQCVIWQSRLQ